jgi:uncharacterized protein (TIRG00374 family)
MATVEQDECESPVAPVPGSRGMPSMWGWQTLLSLCIAVALIVFMLSKVDLAVVWRDLKACNKWYVLLGALAHYATYPVRGARWRRALGHIPMRGGVGRFSLVVFFYNAVDNLVPGKLGDLYASHMARINFGIRRSAALGSIFFLRMIDAWIVLMLAALSSWWVFSDQLPEAVAWGLIGGLVLALVITAVLIPFVFFGKSLPHLIPERVREMIDAFRHGMRPANGELITIAGLTMLVWALEAVWMFCLVRAFGVAVSLPEIIFLTQLPLLASTFPLTPSGAGVVEATLYGCLRLVSVAHPMAASITVLNRLIDYWLHIWLGLLTWLFRKTMGLHSWREAEGFRLEDTGQQDSLPAM